MLIALLSFAACPAFAQAMEEATIRRLIAEVDRALAARNLDAVAHHISETARLTVETNVGGNVERITMSKAEYVDAIRLTWATVDEYDVRRSNVRISLTGGRATITSTVSESITVRGKTLRTTSTDTSIVELIDGRPQVTSASPHFSHRVGLSDE
jgi:hypothetical protein